METECRFWLFWVEAELTTREEQQAKLETVRGALAEEWRRSSDDYVWNSAGGPALVQRDAPAHIYGRLECGEGVDDEWVTDDDGEFLLIEAARALPRWLDTGSSQHRVWINEGRLKIVPAERSDTGVRGLTLDEALFFVRNRREDLVHDERLERHAFRRIRGLTGVWSRYREKMRESMHRTRVVVPRTVAQLLHAAPGLIAAATHEVYTRDAISLKACEKMDMFFPKDMVSVVVRTTKMLHAQLKGQVFHRHPLFELPAPGSLDYEKAVMGMKIACGFEMLCAKRSPEHPVVYPNWTSFLEKLERSGYFEGEKEGSAKYKSLRKNAVECFLKSKPSGSVAETINDPLSQISDILKQELPTDEDISKWPDESDSDDFLNVSPGELDELMRSRTTFSSDEDVVEKTQKPLSNDTLGFVVEKFENFVNNDDAGPDGINPESDFFGDTTTDSDISFDEEEFIRLMKETLGKNIGYTFSMTLLSIHIHIDISDEHLTDVKNCPTLENLASNQQSLDDSTSNEPAIQDFMNAMDIELSSTTLKDSFSNLPTDTSCSVKENEDANIQYNLLKNLYESAHGQHGAPGPTDTLLKSMHLSLPPDSSLFHSS
ncbi:hypothetical protein PMAC_003251 [Pneumocystis sp. 'macacae']|nr:hypothetical protein PMAC_003251 [Pneumocystis sp. 'macacae']